MADAGSVRDTLVARLKYVIELRGKSVARVEKELGRSRGFLGDALRGGKRLPIETILEVARRSPVIRFDAAMVLTRKHYHRLWFPRPGSGGDIPSRR